MLVEADRVPVLVEADWSPVLVEADWSSSLYFESALSHRVTIHSIARLVNSPSEISQSIVILAEASLLPLLSVFPDCVTVAYRAPAGE